MTLLKSSFSRMLLALTFLTGMTSNVVLAANHSPAVKIEHARIRLLPGNLPLAGYFDLTNAGHDKLILTGATSKAFGDVMLHRTEIVNGEAKMEMLDQMVIDPGKTIHFAPQGYHLMLMDRSHPLTKGDSVPIRLEFAGGQSIDAKFTVMGADLK